MCVGCVYAYVFMYVCGYMCAYVYVCGAYVFMCVSV